MTQSNQTLFNKLEMKNVNDLFNLSSKTAVVTGGLGHLGFAMTQTLLELGACVIVTITKNELKNSEILAKQNLLKKEYPGKIFVEVIDFFNDTSLKTFFKKIEKKYKVIDILVNNAFAGVQKPIEKMSGVEFSQSVEGALTSVYKCSLLALPLMKKRKKGVIINIASMYGVVAPDPRAYVGTPFNSTPSYGPSKAGVIQLTKYLASYWAQYGIRVNSISPGPFPNQANVKNTTFLKRLKEKTMLGRLGTPQDLKGIIALLSSDASGYVTGQNFIIDGGWTAW